MYIKKSKIAIGVILIVLLTALITVNIINPFGFANFGKFIKFVSTARLIDMLYYEDVDEGNALESAISGMATSMGDPYTAYLWGDDAKEYLEDINGDYCGVGLYIEKDEDNLISVISPILGGEGEKAGIKTGDKILAIDGVYFSGDQLNEAASTMRGEEGTEVTVLIRKSDGTEQEIVLKRSRIVLDSATGRMLDGEVAYIGVSQFTKGVSDEFLTEIKDLSDKGMKYLIVDLRNNPGGLLDEVINICSLFIEDEKVITYTEDKYGSKTEYCSNSKFSDEKYNVPVVILTNGGSASASEVMTGAMKDYGKAKVIGEKTFGKGIVQSVLTVGDGILSVTTSRYFSPNGVCIHGEGIKPDIEVDMQSDNNLININSDFINDDLIQMAAGIVKE